MRRYEVKHCIIRD